MYYLRYKIILVCFFIKTLSIAQPAEFRVGVGVVSNLCTPDIGMAAEINNTIFLENAADMESKLQYSYADMRNKITSKSFLFHSVNLFVGPKFKLNKGKINKIYLSTLAGGGYNKIILKKSNTEFVRQGGYTAYQQYTPGVSITMYMVGMNFSLMLERKWIDVALNYQTMLNLANLSVYYRFR